MALLSAAETYDAVLSEHLAMRGGTVLHKAHLAISPRQVICDEAA